MKCVSCEQYRSDVAKLEEYRQRMPDCDVFCVAAPGTTRMYRYSDGAWKRIPTTVEVE